MFGVEHHMPIVASVGTYQRKMKNQSKKSRNPKERALILVNFNDDSFFFLVLLIDFKMVSEHYLT